MSPLYASDGHDPNGEVTMEQVAKQMFAMAGGDAALPNDRPNFEKEWAFRGTSKDESVDLNDEGGRAVGVIKWKNIARTRYNIYSCGGGVVSDIWVWSCYPKGQWSEEDARDAHNEELKKYGKIGS